VDIPTITAAVQALDHHPRIAAPRVGRWLAWPMIKPVLYFSLLGQFAGRQDAEVVRSSLATRGKDFMRRLGWAARGSMPILAPGPWRERPHLVALTSARSRRERLADGRHLDVHFDALLDSHALPLPAFVIEDAAGWDHVSPIAGPRHAFEEGLAIAASALARTLAGGADIRGTAAALAAIVAEAGLPIERDRLQRRFLGVLAGFEATRRVWRWMLAGRAARALLLLDSDAEGGVIAAARETGIPVVELQHGIAGADHVGYQWAPSMAAHRPDMPVPDRILVFGALWRALFTRGGFWREEEIVPVGTARMERYWDVAARRAERAPGGTLRILFATQWTCRAEAIALWSGVLEASSAPIEVLFKIHPVERRQSADYEALAARHPGRARVVDATENTFQAMLDADVVASFYSTSLIEAAALGIPAVSILGGPPKGGLAGATGIAELAEDVVHVGSVQAMAELIAANAPSSPAYREWQARTRERGRRFFLPGFVDNASTAIAEVLRR
jgi:hypothetical protein